MSLTWHIVKKDLRRLAWPLALWLAFGVMRVVMALRLSHGDRVAGFEGLGYLTNTFAIIDGAVGFLLAAWLVMEDSLVSARAFWPTRPISGARLLGAKLWGAVLMFGVLPVLVMTPIWIGCGFSAGEIARAAGELSALNGIWILVALAMAAMTETSGQFLVRMLGGLPLGFYFLAKLTSMEGKPGLQDSRLWVIAILLFATPVVVIVNQFLTRRAGRSWSLLGALMGLTLASALFWSWDFSPLLIRLGSRNVVRDHPQDRGIRFVLARAPEFISDDKGKQVVFSMEMSVNGASSGDFVSIDQFEGVLVASDARKTEVYFSKKTAGVIEIANVARRLVGLPALAETEGLNWSFQRRLTDGQRAEVAGKEIVLRGDVRAALMRGRVLGEMPLRLAAEVRVGASVTRIARIERDDKHVMLVIEERDTARAVEDHYVLVNRRTGFNQSLAINGYGRRETLRTNSIQLSQRQIAITPPMHEVNGRMREVADWEDGAVLVKVRFTPERTLVRAFESAPFVLGPTTGGN